jgi:hypothetical protein
MRLRLWISRLKFNLIFTMLTLLASQAPAQPLSVTLLGWTLDFCF